jgi:hypothetical protein
MSKTVVADHYEMIRVNGTYSKENNRLVRKGMKVLQTYVNDTNANTKHNGKNFIVDQEATEKFYEYQEKKNAERQLKASTQGITAESLINALVGSKEAVKVAPKKEDIEGDLRSISLKDLRLLHKDIKATSVEAFVLQIEEKEALKLEAEKKKEEAPRLTEQPKD